MPRTLATLCLIAFLTSPAFATASKPVNHAGTKKYHSTCRSYHSTRKKGVQPYRHPIAKTKTPAPKLAMPLPVPEEPLLVEISHRQIQALNPVIPAVELKRHRSWFHLPKKESLLAIPTTKQSWVMPLSDSDASQLGTMIAETIHATFPEAKTLYLRPLAEDNPLTTCLKYRLNTLGYKLSDAEDGSLIIRYRVNRLHQGILVSLQFPGQQISRFYGRSPSGTLVAGGPVSSLEEP